MWRLWIVVLMFITASWAICSRMARETLNPQTTSFVIITIAWLFVFGLTYNKWNFSGEQINIGLTWAVIAGLLGGANNLLIYRLMKESKLANIITLQEMYILLVPIFAYFFLGESITIKQGIGIAFASSAIYFLMF
jgi:uncharacterized membrane protein